MVCMQKHMCMLMFGLHTLVIPGLLGELLQIATIGARKASRFATNAIEKLQIEHMLRHFGENGGE